MQTNLHTMQTSQLRAMIDSHDCHLSPEDGCQCEDWQDELMLREDIKTREQNAIQSIKDILMQWCYPKIDGMSANEIALKIFNAL